MMNVPGKCPFCKAARCPASNEYECGSVHDGRTVTYRNTRCYETEIATLRARNDVLEQVTVPALHATIAKLKAENVELRHDLEQLQVLREAER